MKYGDLTINEVITLIESVLNWRKDVDALLAEQTPAKPKYGAMRLGQNEALVNILGGMGEVEAILRGEKNVILTDAIIRWFDKHGRRIPPRMLTASVMDANRNFFLKQTKPNYAERLARIRDCFALKEVILADEFGNRVEAILDGLYADKNTQSITNGVHVPFYLPKMQVNDYGWILDNVFLPAVERSYKVEFPMRNFNNLRKGSLAGQITIAEGSRHERLVEAMQKGNVVGIYFPTCLQGFSIDADREQMVSLPDKFLLAGGFDIAGAMVAFPDILARDSKTPMLDLAATWQSDHGLFFSACDAALDFGFMRDIGRPRVNHAAGLVVLG